MPTTIPLRDGVRDGARHVGDLVLRDFNETDVVWFVLNPTPDLGEVLRQVSLMTGERLELLQFLTQDDLLAVLHAFDAQVAKLLKGLPTWQS